MTLRARLTVLYAALFGGSLLILSLVVYLVLRVSLLRQVDSLLLHTADSMVDVLRVDSTGRIIFSHAPDVNVAVQAQVWGRDGRLHDTLMNIIQDTQPLDPSGLQSNRPTFRDVYRRGQHLRVLSVPLFVGGRWMGTLEVGANLAVVDATLENTLIVQVIAAAGLLLIAAFISWLAIGHTLKPLDTVTATAMQINRADDLSQRIPYQGRPDDEIGRLIYAFNQTLERLELLFTTQQRFLADVSHELRTPLTIIKGNVDLMRRMKTLDEEALVSIDQEANRLKRLVGDLLLLVQAESGRMRLNMAPVELDTLLLEVFQEMRVLAGEKIHLHLTDIDQAIVQGDRDRLKQVLLNLVSNAVQYTPPGGDVFLSLDKVGNQARLVVRDTGPGIPKEDLPHIFERFYRAEKSRHRSSDGGFGLGLSIAHWIVDHHGGTIEVASQEGEGTTFCVWLPLLQEEENLSEEG
ncbi:MAG: sensor histidine kinase [Anaerolineae bacterium]|nr:MAG: sensor histidine kinase [Anaerolineae bacterium]